MTVTEFIDGNFDNIIASLPDGMNGFLKSWGLQKFAETVLMAFLNETGPKTENRDYVNPHTDKYRNEILRLRNLASICYVGLGDLPENWLDALWAASEGEPFSTDGLLPFVKDAD